MFASNSANFGSTHGRFRRKCNDHWQLAGARTPDNPLQLSSRAFRSRHAPHADVTNDAPVPGIVHRGSPDELNGVGKLRPAPVLP